MSALKFLIEKEFKQFRRNSFLPKMVIIFPIMIMLVMPWIATMDIKSVKLDIVDNDRSTTSKRLIEKIDASDYFIIQRIDNNYKEAIDRLEFGKTDVIVEIPYRYEKSINRNTPLDILIAANSVDGTKGSLASSYLSSIMSKSSNFKGATVHNLYNNTLNYRNYMIPALMVALVIMLTGFLPALNVVSEKENGTIEQINVTPVGKFEFIFAKLIPYWIISILVLSVCFIIAWLLYGLIPEGSYLNCYIITMLFALAMSGLGLIISNYSATMQQAMFVMYFFMMIFMLMSGLFTPIASMPDWARIISLFFPPRYFIECMRSIFLKGSTFMDLWIQYAITAFFAILLNSWAIISYRKRS